MNLRIVSPIGRFLAPLLILSLALPNPALALRGLNAESPPTIRKLKSGLEEGFSARKLPQQLYGRLKAIADRKRDGRTFFSLSLARSDKPDEAASFEIPLERISQTGWSDSIAAQALRKIGIMPNSPQRWEVKVGAVYSLSIAGEQGWGVPFILEPAAGLEESGMETYAEAYTAAKARGEIAEKGGELSFRSVESFRIYGPVLIPLGHLPQRGSLQIFAKSGGIQEVLRLSVPGGKVENVQVEWRQRQGGTRRGSVGPYRLADPNTNLESLMTDLTVRGEEGIVVIPTNNSATYVQIVPHPDAGMEEAGAQVAAVRTVKIDLTAAMATEWKEASLQPVGRVFYNFEAVIPRIWNGNGKQLISRIPVKAQETLKDADAGPNDVVLLSPESVVDGQSSVEWNNVLTTQQVPGIIMTDDVRKALFGLDKQELGFILSVVREAGGLLLGVRLEESKGQRNVYLRFA